VALAIQGVSDEKRLELLFDAVIDYAIYMLDTAGNVSSWNAGAERIKGYRAAEIVGQHFSIFYGEEDRRNDEPGRALAIAAAEGKYEREGWRVRKDGTRFWANVVIDAIRDEKGQLVGFAKITRDATERRDAQEALEQARAALAQSQKMEAIGQLTGGIAHDFNNLLTVVSNNLDLILQHTSDTARVRRLAEGALRAAGRGAKLTQQLLAFARRQPLRPETVDVNTLIGAIEAIMRRAAGEGVSVVLELGEKVSGVRLDAPQLEAALLNLVLNARDAMPDGGVLSVKTEDAQVTEGDAAAALGVAPGRYALVTVRDTGAGMSSEVQAHAFEPFFTTKEPGKGSGLGLSQVYGFVAQSSGHVVLDSAPGRGTAILLYLPQVEGASAPAPAAQAKPRRATVLVVEDDPDVLESAVEMVRGLGYDVLAAANGIDAMAVLRRNVAVDVLFSDIVMPRGMNGVELAKEARRLRPGLRILLSSGYASAILAAEHGLTADFSFIGKPYRWPDLAEKLRAGLVMH
jgi:PAS domain S-box-containing protein